MRRIFIDLFSHKKSLPVLKKISIILVALSVFLSCSVFSPEKATPEVKTGPLSLDQALTIVAQASREAARPGRPTRAPAGQESSSSQDAAAPATDLPATVIAQAAQLVTSQSVADQASATPKASLTFTTQPQEDNQSNQPAITARPTYTPKPTRTPTQKPTRTHTPTLTATRSPGLAGLSLDDVTNRLQQEKGFSCSDSGGNDTTHLWMCEYQSGTDVWYHVDIYGTPDTPVFYLFAAVFQSQPSDSAAIEILSYLAALPYSGSNPQQARDWIASTLPTCKTVDDKKKTNIGGLNFTLYGGPDGRYLEMGDPVN